MTKGPGGKIVPDYPSYNTAAGARSHMKCFLLSEFKIDLDDKMLFPKWNSWWKSYLGEVLKPNKKMKVSLLFFLLLCCF